MKKYLLVISFIFLSSLSFAQTGVWSGDVSLGNNTVPLVFHFDEENPTIDSPAQGVKGIPISVTRNDQGISISVPTIGASFEGMVENDKISGTFRQSLFSLPLTLTPGETKPNRPQTPSAPGPYTEEEVSFTNGNAVLKGTLTLPLNYNKETPVVLMVTGSGLQNRDEEIFDHKPFAVIADALARKGIATLRYDDRGFGQSTGDVINATTEDFMLDALSGVNLLRGRFNHVGVLGHSEGGTIAFMLGADKKVDFIISLAGMTASGKETLLSQNRKALMDAGMPGETIDTYGNLLSKIFDNELKDGDIDAATLSIPLKQNLKAVVKQMDSPYFSYIVNLDLRPRLKDVACPVLALNGIKDSQVDYQPNLDALKNSLPSNPKNKIEALDGLNHLFQHCETGSTLEYGKIEETFSPEVLSTIAEWIINL